MINPCDICMGYPGCTKQEIANQEHKCDNFITNILVTVPRSLSVQYPGYLFISAIDITTGFLKIVVHRQSYVEQDD